MLDEIRIAENILARHEGKVEAITDLMFMVENGEKLDSNALSKTLTAYIDQRDKARERWKQLSIKEG